MEIFAKLNVNLKQKEMRKCAPMISFWRLYKRRIISLFFASAIKIKIKETKVLIEKRVYMADVPAVLKAVAATAPAVAAGASIAMVVAPVLAPVAAPVMVAASVVSSVFGIFGL